MQDVTIAANPTHATSIPAYMTAEVQSEECDMGSIFTKGYSLITTIWLYYSRVLDGVINVTEGAGFTGFTFD